MPNRGRKRRGSRRTLLKIRAVPLVRMPKSKFFELIRQAARTGIVPPEIKLTTLNWDHARGATYLPGAVLSAREHEELKATYDLLAGMEKGDIRVETPDT